MSLDGIKFHLLLKLESYMQERHPLFNDLKKWLFTEEQWSQTIDYAINKGLEVVTLCNDVESVEFVRKKGKGIVGIELHAISLNDYFLLEEASKFSGVIILGVGGSMLDEVSYAVNFLKSKGKNDILLMYGFQSFPTDYSKINLSKMGKIKEMFNLPVGYADHTSYDDKNNEIISVMAAAIGFNILEKHYTPDLGKERIDYQAAVSRKQMIKIKELLKLALIVHGDESLEMSKDEQDYGKTGPMKKAIVAKGDIMKDEKLSLDNLWFKRTKEESNVKQSQFQELLRLKAKRNINDGDVIDFKDLEDDK